MTRPPNDTVRDIHIRDEAFDVPLPVNDRVDFVGATHVARMRGSRDLFVDVLAEFVRTGSELSAPLRIAVVDAGEAEIVAALESLGPARVESIEELSKVQR